MPCYCKGLCGPRPGLFRTPPPPLTGRPTTPADVIHGLAGNDTLIGTTDKVTVHDWFASSANRLEKITAVGDNKTLNLSKLNNLVTAMSGFTAAATAGTDLPANIPKAVTQLIASSWTAA
jgi:hypothetical protein